MRTKTSKKVTPPKQKDVQCSEEHRCWLRNWFLENYVMRENTRLQSQLVYTHYTYSCSVHGTSYIDRESFFQVMKEVFPKVDLQRMAGKRDKDGWEYAGLDILPSCEEYTSVSKGRRVSFKMAAKRSCDSDDTGVKKAAKEQSTKEVSTNTDILHRSESEAQCLRCRSGTSSRSSFTAPRVSPEKSKLSKASWSQKFFFSIECIRKDLDSDEIIVSVQADSAMDVCTSNSGQGSNATLTVRPQPIRKEIDEKHGSAQGLNASNDLDSLNMNSEDNDSDGGSGVNFSSTPALQNSRHALKSTSKVSEASSGRSAPQHQRQRVCSGDYEPLIPENSAEEETSDENAATEMASSVKTIYDDVDKSDGFPGGADDLISSCVQLAANRKGPRKRKRGKGQLARKTSLKKAKSSLKDSAKAPGKRTLPAIDRVDYVDGDTSEGFDDSDVNASLTSDEDERVQNDSVMRSNTAMRGPETSLNRSSDGVCDSVNLTEPEIGYLDPSDLTTEDSDAGDKMQKSLNDSLLNTETETDERPASSPTNRTQTPIDRSENDTTVGNLQLPNLRLAMTANLDTYFRVGKKNSSIESKRKKSSTESKRDSKHLAGSEAQSTGKEGSESDKCRTESRDCTENEVGSRSVRSHERTWQTLPKKFKEEHWDLVQQWLEGEFEESSSVCLPRLVIFNHYLDMCKSRGLVPSTQGKFGRMIMHRFKQLTMRRLGSRGNSQYCYMGVDVREESAHYNDISQHRVVCTLGKPKHSTFPQGSKGHHR